MAPRCASACARSSPVCRCPVSLSVCRRLAHSAGLQAGRICSQHSCYDATTLKDLRATGCISARSSALRATGVLLSNHTATRRVGSVGRGDAGSLTRCFAAPNPWTTDLPKPILAACMQGCSPPPRLSVRVAPRCASACARSSPVCRSPVSLSVYRQRWHTVQACSGQEDLQSAQLLRRHYTEGSPCNWLYIH